MGAPKRPCRLCRYFRRGEHKYRGPKGYSDCDKKKGSVHGNYAACKEFERMKDEKPPLLFLMKAARQLGIMEPLNRFTMSDGALEFLARTPEHDVGRLVERAWFLEDREARGLPTELTPSGRMPDSHDEVDDPVAFRIGIDRKKKVIAIHHGRPLKAFDIHPAAARALGMALMHAADQVDPDGASLRDDPKLVGVAYVHAEDGNVREANLEFNNVTDIPELEE